MRCVDLEGTSLTLEGLCADATVHFYKHLGKQGCLLVVQQWPSVISCAGLG